MQRRAAAVYAALLILVAVGAYATLAVAEEPTVGLDAPRYAQGDTLTANGRTYTVSSVSDGSAELAWTNESAVSTESWDTTAREFEGADDATARLAADGDVPTATVGGTEFRVVVTPANEPTEFSLVEAVSLPDNLTTVDRGDTTYAWPDGEAEPVPLSEYVLDAHGAPEVRSYAEGDTLEYQNQTVTVAEVANESVTVEWTAPAENTVTFEEGTTRSLNGREVVAHFPDASTLQLTTDVDAYEREQAVIDTFQERQNGLWAAVILSILTAVLLMGMAYLPSRY